MLALVTEGYASEAVANGFAALARLARGDVDLVLLDLTMPGLDGLAVYGQVCAHAQPVEPSPPIIMPTARADAADQRDRFAAGADDYVLKPLQVRTLMAHIAVWLRVRRALQTALAARVQTIHLTIRALADRLNNPTDSASVLGPAELHAALPEDIGYCCQRGGQSGPRVPDRRPPLRGQPHYDPRHAAGARPRPVALRCARGALA